MEFFLEITKIIQLSHIYLEELINSSILSSSIFKSVSLISINTGVRPYIIPGLTVVGKEHGVVINSSPFCSFWFPRRSAVRQATANKLAEEYNRPAFLWGRDGNGVFKGSCRSGGGVSVVKLMNAVP